MKRVSPYLLVGLVGFLITGLLTFSLIKIFEVEGRISGFEGRSVEGRISSVAEVTKEIRRSQRRQHQDIAILKQLVRQLFQVHDPVTFPGGEADQSQQPGGDGDRPKPPDKKPNKPPSKPPNKPPPNPPDCIEVPPLPPICP